MPQIELRWLNCVWLLFPLLVWNLVLAPKIALEQVTSDANSPAWLLATENLTRIIVFASPLLLQLRWDDALSRSGWAVYLVGTLIYFASWIPLLLAPQSAWSQSTAGLLAPRLTPFLLFAGIAMIGNSLAYALVSALFIALHTWHGVQNLLQ